MVENAPAAFQTDRSAKGIEAHVGAYRRRFLQRESVQIHIAGNVQIQIAIAIEIAERAARVPFHVAAQPSRGRDFGERAIAVVLIEKIDADIGDQDIGEPVVVVIDRVSSRAPIGIRESGALRDVFKFSVAQIVEQINAGARRFGRGAGYHFAQLIHR